jgi:peptidoglycan/xylan/chitin deacetylase (PgdA/CDA1 family)
MMAQAMRLSGGLRLAQSFSERYEIERSPNGRTAGIKRVCGPKFVVLCYHRVGSGGAPFYSNLDPAVFEAQIRFLRRAYRIVSLDEMCRELEAGGPQGQAVAITFDDGYRDLYSTAYPILRRYSVPATIYLTAGAIESGEISWYDRIFVAAMLSRSETLEIDGDPPRTFQLSSRESRLNAATEIVSIFRKYPNSDRIAACVALERKAGLSRAAAELKDRMLTWEQAREMQDTGITFGAHTMNHPVVSQLAPAERDLELGASKRLLENRLQRSVDHFAFPFGSPADIDAESCALLPRYGYRSAVSTVWGLNTPETPRFLLRRMGGDELSLSLFALRLAWLFLNQQPASEGLDSVQRQLESQPRVLATSRLEHHEAAPEVKRA